MTRFRWGVATDIGRTRSVNQDSAYAAEGFYAVADGMGGHQGGEIASAVAIETLAAALPVVSTEDVLTAIHAANRAVLDRARDDPSLRGMGTTLCVLALVAPDGEGPDVAEDEPFLVLANVGDSRAYQFAGGVLEQMTDDHSMVGELVRQGRISAAEAESHPQRNILTRALGIDHRTQIDAWHVRPVPGDRWLLCSDGLFNEVSERTIADVLAAIDDPIVAARHLVQLAIENGGRDNITVLVADVLADDGHAAPAPLGALQEGELASARRRVPHEPPAEAVVPTAPTGGAGRADLSSPAGDDREPAAERAPAAGARPPGAAPATVTTSGPAGERGGLVGRARAGWRVVAFGVAFLAVVAVAVGAWVTLRDESSGDGPLVPVTPTAVTSSTSTSTSSTTTNTTTTTSSTTTTLPPAPTGSAPS